MKKIAYFLEMANCRGKGTELLVGIVLVERTFDQLVFKVMLQSFNTLVV